MRNTKKLLAILLTAVMLVSSMAPVFAEETISKEAKICYDLGLLSGDQDGFNSKYLAKSTTKMQAAIVMLKLLGRYETAVDYTYGVNNFKDADQMLWKEGKNILSYLKDNPDLGWQGNPDGTFGIKDMANSQMLYKVMLEVLGYTYDNTGSGDFTWGETIEFAESVGLGRISGWNRVTNDDLAVCIVETLQIPVSGGSDEETLLAKLAEQNADFAKKAEEAGLWTSDEAQSVKQLAPVDVEFGGVPVLPAKVTVVYKSGSTKEMNVAWDTVDTNIEGPQSIEGTIEGLSLKAAITVNVIPKNLDFTVSTANLKEVTVTFNKAVDRLKAENKGNYTVKVGNIDKGIQAITLSDDKKSVLLLLNSELKQQDRVDVTVKTGIGMVADITKTIESVKDVLPPIVEKVEAVGNKLVRITFSEPVMNTTNISNYTLDGKSIYGSITAAGRTANIVLSRRLDNGMHTLEVNKNIVDYAGYNLIFNSNQFEVVKDTTPPSVELVKATQAELVVKFSEPVETIYSSKVTTKSSSSVTSVTPGADLQTYTISFNRTSALPVNGTEVTFTDVTDYSNIKATLKLKVVPSIDTEAPVYLGYTVEQQSKIIIQYSEPVSPMGTYLLTDSKGAVVALSTPMWLIDAGLNVDRSRVVLQRPGNGTFADGTYTLQINGVVDYTPLENKLVPQVVNVAVQDQTAPQVIDVKVSGQQLFVAFSEKVNDATAILKTNYRYIENLASKPLPAGTTVELLSDGSTVQIAFPDNFNMAGINAFQVENIADLNGNLISVTAKAAPFGTVGTAPVITEAAVTDKNTITLTLSSPINPETLSVADFIVDAGELKLTVTEAQYDQKDMKINLTVNGDINTDGMIAGRPILLKTAAGPLSTSNVYGQKLQPVPVAIVTDRYAPYITGVTASLVGGNTNIVLTLSENIKTTNGSGKPLVTGANELNQFIVLADGDVKTVVTSRYDNSDSTQPARITLTISGDQTGREINVKFYAGPTNTLTDFAQPKPNSLQNVI